MVFIRKGNIFFGFVTAGGRRYTFTMTVSDNLAKVEGCLNVDWRLKRQLGENLNAFLKDYSNFSDPEEFYRQFNSFVQNNLGTSNKIQSWLQNPTKTVFLVESLQQEMEKIGKFIKNFDLETGLVEIEVTDCQLRIHKAVLRLGQNYRNEPISVISHELPQFRTGTQCNPNFDNLFLVADFCKKFSEFVDCFQQFWNTMSLLDAQCCVLDPVNPTFKHVFRRIKLTDTLSVVLTFNPFCALQTPKIKLLGCQSDVNHYQNILQKNLESEIWDNEEDLLFNLSNVLEVSVPNKIFVEETKGPEAAEDGECAICFTWRLNEEIPNEVCENSNCKSIYHSTCLFTYFSSIPRNRDYFGKIQGECPNCDCTISCTVPKLI